MAKKVVATLKKEGAGKYNKGSAIITIISGAGGDDAEDFSAMLLRMYMKFLERKNFGFKILHENQNDHGVGLAINPHELLHQSK